MDNGSSETSSPPLNSRRDSNLSSRGCRGVLVAFSHVSDRWSELQVPSFTHSQVPEEKRRDRVFDNGPRVSLFCVRLYVAAGSRAYYLFKKWRGFTIDTTLILEDRTGHKICVGGLGDRTGELVISLLQELVSGGAGDAIEDGVTLIISPAMA